MEGKALCGWDVLNLGHLTCGSQCGCRNSCISTTAEMAAWEREC